MYFVRWIGLRLWLTVHAEMGNWGREKSGRIRALDIGTGGECYHVMYAETYDTRDSTVVPLRSTKHA
jgi:hypothetical protein